jgi:hypothetical protein
VSAQRQSFTDFDRPYRRGVVIGLSLAELFIILVFLLLLTIVGYAVNTEQALMEKEELLAAQVVGKRNAENEAEASRNQVKGLEDKLVLVRSEGMRIVREMDELEKRAKMAEGRLHALIKDGDPNELIVALREIVIQQIDKTNELQDSLITIAPIVNIGRKIEKLSQESRLSPNNYIADFQKQKKKIKNSLTEMAQLRDALISATPAAKIGEQIQKIARDFGVSTADLINSTRKIEGLKQHLSNLKGEAKALKETLDQKGQDSPCWFRLAKRSNGIVYEKGLYIFDVRISDRHIFVKDIAAPTAEYQKQKELLNYDRAALNKKLRFVKFSRAFRSLKLAGVNKEIRSDRRCTFYVRVWDATNSKSAYKRAINYKVQRIFSTYEVRDDPWPYK